MMCQGWDTNVFHGSTLLMAVDAIACVPYNGSARPARRGPLVEWYQSGAATARRLQPKGASLCMVGFAESLLRHRIFKLYLIISPICRLSRRKTGKEGQFCP